MSHPFFPTLRPLIANHFWFNIDTPINEEAEVQQLEREQQAWFNSIRNAGSDIQPIGKVLTLPGPETDDEDANDSDDSDSRDDDDDTIDRIIAAQPDAAALGISYSPMGDIIGIDEIPPPPELL